MKKSKSLALLSTGYEILNGDCVDSNAVAMSKILFSKGIFVSHHMSVGDDPLTIKEALKFLLANVDVLIMTGGLGPTLDDHTRRVVADFMGVDLVLSHSSLARLKASVHNKGQQWLHITSRMAYFPKGADVFYHNGSLGMADGFVVEVFPGKWVMALPGPSNECIWMFENWVLEFLSQQGFVSDVVYKNYYVYALKESQLAEKIEQYCPNSKSKVGYRASVPFVEVKWFLGRDLYDASNHTDVYDDELRAMEKSLADLWIKKPVEGDFIDLFIHALAQRKVPLFINDHVTCGHLQSLVTTPFNRSMIIFNAVDVKSDFLISGLDQYWRGEADEVTVSLSPELGSDTLEFSFPVKPHHTPKSICHWICYIFCDVLQVLG